MQDTRYEHCSYQQIKTTSSKQARVQQCNRKLRTTELLLGLATELDLSFEVVFILFFGVGGSVKILVEQTTYFFSFLKLSFFLG